MIVFVKHLQYTYISIYLLEKSLKRKQKQNVTFVKQLQQYIYICEKLSPNILKL